MKILTKFRHCLWVFLKLEVLMVRSAHGLKYLYCSMQKGFVPSGGAAAFSVSTRPYKMIQILMLSRECKVAPFRRKCNPAVQLLLQTHDIQKFEK